MDLVKYEQELHNRELSKNTIIKYLRDVKNFLIYAGDQELSQELLIRYKAELLAKFKISTVNNKITIINNFLMFMKLDIKVKQEREQKNNILDSVLSEGEYRRLLKQSVDKNKPRTRIIMLSLYYTGLRVSELQFLTVEALKQGFMEVHNKDKRRRVPICIPLSVELKKYIKEQGITSGYIIINAKGESLSRGFIFKELKWIGGQARVKKSKVFPHSFRHLFAKQYLKLKGNTVLGLADVLGHSNLDTTRIYTTLSTDEQREAMNI